MSLGYSVPSAAAHALLHAVWQGALLAWIAAVVLARIPARRAAARHAVALACLLAVALAPVITFLWYRAAAASPGPLPLLGGRPLGPPVPGGALSPGEPGPIPLLLRPADWIIVALPLLWLLGAAALLVRQLGGWRVVVALSRRPAGALPVGWSRRVDDLRRSLGIARAVALRPAIGTASPFTAGALRPIIWVPVGAFCTLTPAQQDALLAHELAHVRRLDWIWNGLQSVIEALWFFHPAVRWLGRRVREEREHACDETAARACGDPIALAEALTALARLRAAPDLALAAHGGALLRRVARLLDAPVSAPVRSPRWIPALLAGGVALAVWIRLPVDVLIDLRVDASTDGPLTPGAYREITAESFGARRHYRATMDARGELRERYEVDEAPQPIDPAVRSWLSAVTRTAGR